MLLLSIVVREFRQAARNKRAHWLRLLFGGGIASWFVFVVLKNVMSGTSAPGHAAYNAIVWPLALGIAVLAPALSAPSIARERREGTLPLLFHTHLGPFHIVLAKFSARLTELFLFILVVLPFLALPVWLGGVSHREALSDTCVLLGLGLFGTAAGLFASSVFRNENMALVMALVGLCCLDPLLSLANDSFILLGIGGLLPGFSPDLFSGESWLAAAAAANPKMIQESLISLAVALLGSIFLLVMAALRVARIARAREELHGRLEGRMLWRWIGIGNWVLLMASGLWYFWFTYLESSGAQLPAWTGWWPPYCSFIACFVLVILASLSTSREKDENTLESLVTTPLSNQAMVSRGIATSARSCWGVIAFFYAPILYAMITEDWDSLTKSFLFALWFFLLPFFAVSIGAFFSAYCRSSMRAVVVSIVTMSIACAYQFACLIDYMVYEFMQHWIVLLVMPFLIVSVGLFFVLLRNFRRFAARQ